MLELTEGKNHEQKANASNTILFTYKWKLHNASIPEKTLSPDTLFLKLDATPSTNPCTKKYAPILTFLRAVSHVTPKVALTSLRLVVASSWWILESRTNAPEAATELRVRDVKRSHLVHESLTKQIMDSHESWWIIMHHHGSSTIIIIIMDSMLHKKRCSTRHKHRTCVICGFFGAAHGNAHVPSSTMIVIVVALAILKRYTWMRCIVFTYFDCHRLKRDLMEAELAGARTCKDRPGMVWSWIFWRG